MKLSERGRSRPSGMGGGEKADNEFQFRHVKSKMRGGWREEEWWQISSRQMELKNMQTWKWQTKAESWKRNKTKQNKVESWMRGRETKRTREQKAVKARTCWQNEMWMKNRWNTQRIAGCVKEEQASVFRAAPSTHSEVVLFQRMKALRRLFLQPHVIEALFLDWAEPKHVLSR